MRSATPAVNKSQVVAGVAGRTSVSLAEADRIVNAFLDEVTDQLGNGHMVRLTGFGTLRPVVRAPREYYNIPTGQKVSTTERTTVRFRLGQSLRNKMAGGDA